MNTAKTLRETRYMVVREMVNRMVPSAEDRTQILMAVSDYGYAASCSGIDTVIESMRKLREAVKDVPLPSGADVLEEMQARR